MVLYQHSKFEKHGSSTYACDLGYFSLQSSRKIGTKPWFQCVAYNCIRGLLFSMQLSLRRVSKSCVVVLKSPAKKGPSQGRPSEGRWEVTQALRTPQRNLCYDHDSESRVRIQHISFCSVALGLEAIPENLQISFNLLVLNLKTLFHHGPRQ